MAFDALAPSSLALTVVSDTTIQLDWTNNSTDADGVSIERSTNGTDYAQITTVLANVATYNDTTGADGTRYYYRLKAYQGTTYSVASNVDDDWCAIKMVLTSTGTGAEVSTVRFNFATTNVVVTLDGAGRWYSDAAGTTDESSSYTFVAGALRTRYLKVTSGVSNMLMFAKGNWTQWGNSTTNVGWGGSTNAATIAKDISGLTNLLYLINTGSNTLSGSIEGLGSLLFLYVTGSNTLSGSVAGLTSLTYLRVYGSNTLTGSVEGLTSLNALAVQGSNTVSGSIAGLTGLTFISTIGSNTLSGAVTNLTSLTYLYLAGSNTVSGDLGGSGTAAVVNGLGTLTILGNNQMHTYTAGATWTTTNSLGINPAPGYGYSSTEIDNMLIDMAASLDTVTAKTITLQGSSAPRTSSSDDAVTTLNGKGWTIVTNSNMVLYPWVGELAITGYVPIIAIESIGSPIEVLPSVGELTLTGYAPTVAIAPLPRYLVTSDGRYIRKGLYALKIKI